MEKWGIVMENPNFIGSYFYFIDSKNRLAIPSKMRVSILREKGLVLSCGLEGCLNLYPQTSWLKLNEKLEGMQLKNKRQYHTFKRILFSSACEVELDEEGRILIPQWLRDYAKLKRDVAIIGVGEKIEIWAKHLWVQYEKKGKNVFKKHSSHFEI